jgi:hypothetical protein
LGNKAEIWRTFLLNECTKVNFASKKMESPLSKAVEYLNKRFINKVFKITPLTYI